MAKYSVDGVAPIVHSSAYVADMASIIGQVQLDENTSVWDFAALRGDNELIHIQAGSNVQEGAVLHTDIGFPLTVGKLVTVGHQACLHGCTVGDGSLIGIRAVVLNGAKIGKHCIIGAGALITEGKEIPDRSLVVGSPGKIVRTLSDEDVARLIGAQFYIEKAKVFKNTLARLPD
ncbi:gamma carbonic anhydrase family protein [Limnobacter humi]|uniref:Gamma carbonic anhydrase family protein n=1 Tax=Limnobacter humi TaxID=1778671 RepID=A0ABT1WI84_9BURK|nr:gamma carbonic anhydrase family protein [Limnobacter humi]MCQ8897208.1 gamma carbonic anhydrase family protein [Limnobacter humi]